MSQTNTGKWVVLLMLFLGSVGGLGALLHNYRMGHHAVEFWGTENALLIDHAPDVEITPLGSKGASSAVNVSEGKGLSNIRRALVLSEAYDWSLQPERSPDFRFQIAFGKGQERLPLNFDPTTGWLRDPASGKQVALRPQVRESLASFIQENLAAAAAEK